MYGRKNAREVQFKKKTKSKHFVSGTITERKKKERLVKVLKSEYLQRCSISLAASFDEAVNNQLASTFLLLLSKRNCGKSYGKNNRGAFNLLTLV